MYDWYSNFGRNSSLITIFNLGLIDGPFAMIWGLIAVFFYARYKITKESHTSIKEQLAIKNT